MKKNEIWHELKTNFSLTYEDDPKIHPSLYFKTAKTQLIVNTVYNSPTKINPIFSPTNSFQFNTNISHLKKLRIINLANNQIPSLNELALQLFKNLQSYMGDRKSSKTPIKHVMKYIRLTINNSEEIKDEAYCQVIKQITDHPSQERALKGWNLLAIMASCFAPSVLLYKAILYYLRDIIRNNTNPAKFVGYIEFIFYLRI